MSRYMLFNDGKLTIRPVKGVGGNYLPPPDKSISHRAAIISAINKGSSIIRNFLFSKDTLATVDCLRKAGVYFEVKEEEGNRVIKVESPGFFNFKEPEDILDAQNSATTMRLLSGVFAGAPFLTVIKGDRYLMKRPMKRVIEPLALMGAQIYSRKGGYPPLCIIGKKLQGISYRLKIPSAQVKSAIIFGGLFANGKTMVYEPVKSRDHTENMLKSLGVPLKVEENLIVVEGISELETEMVFDVPGDPSSAAFMVVAAAISGAKTLIVKNVNLNMTRIGFVEALRRAGANIEVEVEGVKSGEPYGTIRVYPDSRLKGFNIKKDEIPLLIDEVPVLAVAAAYAKGESYFEGLSELRVKETDRLSAIALNLKNMGVKVEVTGDNLLISGGKRPSGGVLNSFGDHRIAMAFTVAALFASGESVLLHPECVDVSYPEFFSDLKSLFVA